MKVPVYNISGEEIKKTDISDSIFAVPFNEAVVHQAMLRQQANARQGNACAKARSEVIGSGRKLFRQKGTGNARAGDAKSPLRKGGGVTFGPKPRDFSQAMPKKMRRLAIKCLLSDKTRNGEMKVLESIEMVEPKTKEMVKILKAFEAKSTTLIATENTEPDVIKSASNLKKVKTLPVNLLNVGDLLSSEVLLITEAAVRQAEKLWGNGATKEVSNASL